MVRQGKEPDLEQAYDLLDELWPEIAARSATPVDWLRRVIEANVRRRVPPPAAKPKTSKRGDVPTFFKKGNK
jgi:hypothetical protein